MKLSTLGIIILKVLVPKLMLWLTKDLEYFATTKLLSWRQACWSEYLSTFNIVIMFQPGRLGTKPDALTCCPDLYPSWGKGDYRKVNPHNLKPIFSSKQLSASLQATSLLPAVLHGVISTDLAQLNMEILSALDTDPIVKSYLTDNNNPKYKNWSRDEQGYVHINECIFVLESGPFQLSVLQYHHSHPVSGHFSINLTLALIRRDYVWPNLCSSVTDYYRSCTTCSRSKSKCHKSYGLLQQLPVPVCPWDSISMDFIKQLPPSSDGFTAILHQENDFLPWLFLDSPEMIW